MADPIQIKHNRELHPQKISVKQYEVGTVLTFVRDSYKYDQIDLRDYKAYAITSFNGEIDYIELTKTVSGTQMTLTWPLSARTLLHEGIISYQIAFKADEDSAAVFNTYQGIIQNSASIDETSIVGDYPTIMKQWLDLIDTRSGHLPIKVEYMYPGKSIPIEERIADTLYYQWEEAHFTTATAATGVVYLGSNPYADSGLYINGKHVYVDDTSDKVHVLEPSVWVDAINAANCGVIAMDNSSGDDIIILLTAATSGFAGNNITYELGLALYGAGAGIQNPSEGKTAGSKLTGGFDAQDGVVNPAGHFEDHFGNTLAESDKSIGEIKYFAHNKSMLGWLLCDGSAVSRETYAKLFDVIGTNWGEGDGSTTFNLPNLIGRVAWGSDTAGDYLDAGLPNITGSFSGDDTGGVATGAFSYSSASTGPGDKGGGRIYEFDASKSNSIYGKSDTVQPPAATLRPFIRY